MRINMLIFLTSSQEQKENNRTELVMKTFESPFRPITGDIIDDPGFDSGFHNGYEVAKVTVNYELGECYVSLQPVAIELEDIDINDYIDKLVANEWRITSKEELSLN
ncbi:hypothetical protein ACQKL5_06635 [Peribacillus sp. NPDC097675]|uniref:hypothetical protein n=1 Tax=Peribacillus sp. NPDC097675 TaxID=3390618 RepID=UPI003CFE0E09